MTFNHMSEEFREKQRENLVAKKAAGISAQQALRDLEIDCGRSNEEFAVDGVPLVEDVFGGRFGGGQGGSFEPNKTSEPEPEPAPLEEQEQAPALALEPVGPVKSAPEPLATTDVTEATEAAEVEEEPLP